MKALQTWVPPRWLHPALAFVLVAAVMAVAGYTYAPSLAIVWPMAGVAAVVISFITGGWNYGDTFGQQACLGMMHILVPPFGISMWIADLQDDRRHNVTRTAVDVQAVDIAGVIGISVFGLLVFAGSVTGFFYIAFS